MSQPSRSSDLSLRDSNLDPAELQRLVAVAREAASAGANQLMQHFGHLERIREQQGVTYYNDSKATNYDAAEVALHALDGPLVVLAGGESKQGNPNSWLAALQQKAAAVVLYGAAQAEFHQLISQAGFSGVVHCCDSLAEAVPLADQLAHSHRCLAVLLSPACASFDQYSDFEARGDHFRELVMSL